MDSKQNHCSCSEASLVARPADTQRSAAITAINMGTTIKAAEGPATIESIKDMWHDDP